MEVEVPPKASRGVWVFLEQADGSLEDVSLEVLGKAREIADELGVGLTGLLLGHEVGNLAEEAAMRGPDVILHVESPLLKEYTTSAYTKVAESLVRRGDPDILLIGATHNGTDLAARLAVRLGAGLMAHVVELEIEEETGMLLGSVPGFGGGIVAVCKCRKGRPQMATVRPGVFKPLEPRREEAGTIVTLRPELSSEDVAYRVVERSVGRGVDISRVDKAVVAGLGCRGDLSLPSRLAKLIGGEVAVSRPLADKGIAPKELVVGSTGVGLSSRLAIILGVSGAPHFTSGIRNVETVIAINTDPEAPIFKNADYCVVGDLFKIVPEIVKLLEGGEARA